MSIFVKTLEHNRKNMCNLIHPSAVIDSKAEIGKNVEIGPFASVHADVVIGDNTKIMQGAFIGKGARIGSGCTIHPYAIVSNMPQDLKFKEIDSTFEIGDNTIIREFVTLHRGTEHSLKSTVGKNCLIMAYAHVAHDCFIGDNAIIANAVQMGGHCLIGNFVTIGGLTAIHQFSKIGDYAMVGGHRTVNKDIPPFSLCTSEPLLWAKVNVIGLRRRNFSAEQILIIESDYKTLYFSGLIVSHAINKIKESFEMTKEVKMIVDFIEGSERGIIRSIASRSSSVEQS
jgi:UDP-N-acetylglucosamine acyltransferase